MSDHLPAPAATARLDHFEPFHFANNLPPDTRETLKAIFANWSDSEKTEARVRQIIDQAPDTLGVRIVAYRFYFYRRRSQEAANWAASCLSWLSRQLDLPEDWRQVTADMADFGHWHAYTRLWLQSLTAYAYNLARLGREGESLAALDKVAELDPAGKLGAVHLCGVFTQSHHDAGMVFRKENEHGHSARWVADC